MIEFKALIDNQWEIVQVRDISGFSLFDEIDKYYVYVSENGAYKSYQIDKEQAKKIAECDRLNTIWLNEESWKPENKGVEKIFSSIKGVELK